jgi:glycosyltransferase involved in cell wall biosynthesis
MVEKMKEPLMGIRQYTYVLVTPARNEEANIEKTIQSVIQQTVLPLRWVIVSDGSADCTDEIIKKYLSAHRWIELVRMPAHMDRQFAAKVQCFNAGFAKFNGMQYDFIGNLDADISFECDYFEYILSKFDADQKLGVAGTPFTDEASGKSYDYHFTNIEHVSGACQIFRRQCFEDIGGYIPLKEGGIDWIAVTTARMKGWRTRTFTEKTCFHHRKIGTGNSNALLAWFNLGRKDYLLGGRLGWEVLRSTYQMTQKPYVARGLFLLSGFAWAVLKREERTVSQDLMRFYRQEQMQRLKKIFNSIIKKASKAITSPFCSVLIRWQVLSKDSRRPRA